MQTCTVMRGDANPRHGGARQMLEKEGKLQENHEMPAARIQESPPLPSQEPGPAPEFFLLKGVFVACLGVKL